MNFCRVTFDPVSHTVYGYVRTFVPAEVARTEAWISTDFYLDGGGQWLGFDLHPKEGVALGGPTTVRFADKPVAHKFPWNQVNVDIDAKGEMLGIEFLFDRSMGVFDRLGNLNIEQSDKKP